jgi:hypothetical protein
MSSSDRAAAALALATAAFVSMPLSLYPEAANAQGAPVRRRARRRTEPPGAVPRTEPVENVGICERYGAGFYFIPGTDTCLRISGRVRTTVLNASRPELAETLNEASRGARLSVNVDWKYLFGFDQERGVGATEDQNQLVNPAYTHSASGEGYSVKISGRYHFADGFWGADDMSKPPSLGFGLEYSEIGGDDWLQNLSFPEGFGFPSVGEIPGIFINAPTHVLDSWYDFEQVRTAAFLEWKQPLFSGRWDLGRHQYMSTVSGIVGLRGGSLNQEESVWGRTFTPVFDDEGFTDFWYDTEFDGGFGGIYVGSVWRSTVRLNDGAVSPIRFKTSLRATMGWDAYCFDVDDRIEISGLGGRIDYSSQNSFNVDESIVTAGLSASIGVGGKHWDISLIGGVDYGKNPELDYFRPDSDSSGNPLQPKLDLNYEALYSMGLRTTLRF